MENINNGVMCDVCGCKHNENGCYCKLNKVRITTDCTDCTCCDSYTVKGN